MGVLVALVAVPACAAFARQAPVRPLGLDPAKPLHQFGHEVWTEKDGLPSATIRDIVQTGDGYLWLATHNGLARFDGARFVVFDPSNTPAMTSSVLVTLLEGRDGSLWIGSLGGGLIRFLHGRFTNYTDHDGLAGDQVTALAEDGGGRVWVVAHGALHILQAGVISLLPVPDAATAATVRDVTVDEAGDLWVTTAVGLFRYHDDRFEQVRPAGLTEDLNLVHADQRGALWIGVTGVGLVRYGGGPADLYSEAEGLASTQVTALYHDRMGTLWIGAERDGLQRLVGGVFRSLATNDGLSDERVLAAYEDREGNLWVGTYNGLNRFSDGSITTYAAVDGWQGGRAAAVLEDRAGAVWVGGEAGLSRFAGGEWTRPPNPLGGDWGAVTTVAEDGQGVLWFGTAAGIQRYADGAHARFTTEHGLRSDAITVIQPRAGGGLWVGSANGRMSWLHRMEGDSIAFVASLPAETRWIHEDRQGRVWWGTDMGLFRLEGDSAARVYEGLVRGAALEAVHEDDAGVLWIGTVGKGLLRIGDGEVASYRVADGLYDDTIWAIVEDERRNLWMSTDRGIFRVNRAQVIAFDEGRVSQIPWVAYGHRDGLRLIQGAGLGCPSGWRGRDGALWFTLWDGVARVAPRPRVEAELFAPAILEEMTAGGEPVAVQDGLELPADRREVMFRYTAPRMRHGDRARFRYQLVGVDEDWVEAGAERVALYPNVPPGSYEFRVVADNGGSGWSEVGAATTFSVSPWFHETLWFRSLAAITVLALLSYAYRLRTRWVVARADNLEREIDEQEEALEALARRERWMRDVLKASPDGIVIVEPSGTIAFANPRAKALFGYGDHPLEGESVEAVLPEYDYAGYAAKVEARGPGGDGIPLDARLESRGLRRDGDAFPAEISVGALRTDDGPVLICAVREAGAAKDAVGSPPS